MLTLPWPVRDTRLGPLVAPIAEQLQDADRALVVSARPALRVGDVEGFFEVLDGEIVLSGDLLAGDLSHPEEPKGPRALDRWRRTLASILEGTVHVGLGPGRGPRWVRDGLAVHLADAACPGLGLADGDLAAARGGDLAGHPRAGVAVIRAWVRDGADAWIDGCRAWSEGVDLDGLLRAAERVLSVEGVGDVGDVPRVRAVDVPTELGPWQIRRVEVPAHDRGGRVLVDGEGRCSPAWAVSGHPLHAIAISGASGCRLVASAGGPVGRWEVRSAAGWGRILGARGVVFDLRADGRLDVVFADAFVGGVDALDAAERIGSSGISSGRWRVAGEHQLAFEGLRTEGVTLHGRGEGPGFAVPGGPGGLGAGLQAMTDAPWSWSFEADRLLLKGAIGGADMSLILARADG